jgi:hypothetical protein
MESWNPVDMDVTGGILAMPAIHAGMTKIHIFL